uniref:Dimer_Tnp_hAT domain-containing protein n=1 Tax=Rhabditophanes sp. KR3021 TaxID=114890 RepID=A0AC35TVX1_9BILA
MTRFNFALKNEILQKAAFCNPNMAYHLDLFNTNEWDNIEQSFHFDHLIVPQTNGGVNRRSFQAVPVQSTCAKSYQALLINEVIFIPNFFKQNGFKIPQILNVYNKFKFVPCTSIRSESGFSRVGFIRSPKRQSPTTENIPAYYSFMIMLLRPVRCN